jgi:hypothetical protein
MVPITEFECSKMRHSFCDPMSTDRRMRIMESEILDDHQLAERWHLNGTADAIAKRFQRLRAL